jgi:GT2 family glycosyltransferase
LKSHEQRHIAEVLRDYRERLESARKDLSDKLDEDGIPVHPIGARMLSVEARMLDVEKALNADLEVSEERARHAPLARLRTLTTPHLGWLHHHPPEQLRVPAGYYTTNPPSPAPKISIVTPSYGQGHFIERTLYSVVSQGYPSLEYVVQDGGSDDGTVSVLRRYTDTLARWVSEPDRGQGDAINRGFAHTSGEIMAYLNSDDLLLPGALAYVAAYFAAHPDVDVVYGNRVMIDEHDREIGSWVLPPHDDEELALLDFVPQETLFWRRSAWEAAGGQIDAGLHFAIDWDLLLRMRESGARMVRLPRFLGAFRVHDAQKTAAWNDQCLIECDALRRRVHGRAISHDEAVARVEPYLRRHVVYHVSHRLRRRLPLRRLAVRTLPHEPWLLAQAPAERNGREAMSAGPSSAPRQAKQGHREEAPGLAHGVPDEAPAVRQRA